MLGSFNHEEAELLSGKEYLCCNATRIFHPILLIICVTISLSGSLALSIKRYLFNKANRNRVQEMHIALEDQNRNPSNAENFNTCTYNMSVLSSYEMFIIYLIALVGIFICVLNTHSVYLRSEHVKVKQNIIFVEVTFEYILGVIVPVYILIKKRMVRNHLWDVIRDMC